MNSINNNNNNNNNNGDNKFHIKAEFRTPDDGYFSPKHAVKDFFK
jgi:hypothetical protein